MDVRTTRIAGLEQLWITRARSTQADSATPASTSTQVSISPEAELLKKMASLKQSDPGRFKEVLGSVSQNLTAAAQNPAAGEINGDLSKLARSLDQVARSGDPGRMTVASSRQIGNRAIEAYMKNARPAAQSETSRQAMQYVLSTLSEATQDVEPASAVRATG